MVSGTNFTGFNGSALSWGTRRRRCRIGTASSPGKWVERRDLERAWAVCGRTGTSRKPSQCINSPLKSGFVAGGDLHEMYARLRVAGSGNGLEKFLGVAAELLFRPAARHV